MAAGVGAEGVGEGSGMVGRPMGSGPREVTAEPSRPGAGAGAGAGPGSGSGAGSGVGPGRGAGGGYRAGRAPAGQPAGTPRRTGLFWFLMGADGVLLGLAAVLFFGGWMDRTWAKATALGALVCGGAMSAIAVSLPKREVPGARGNESRVRVQLTRV
jgi:hypothetical protein